MSTTPLNSETPHGVAPNFDRLAGIYRWMEWLSFGPWLGRCRRAFLPELVSCRHAVVIGDGDGRFTAELLDANRTIDIDAVDASPAMLDALRRSAGAHGSRVRTQIANARDWDPSTDRQYDMVATHFFLDCLTTDEARWLARNVRRSLAPGALWVVSEFAIPDGRFGRWCARPLVLVLYLAFGQLTGLRVRRLPDHEAALLDAEFRLVECRRMLRGLLVSQLWMVDSQ